MKFSELINAYFKLTQLDFRAISCLPCL